MARLLAPQLPPQRLRFMAEDDERFIQIGDDLAADLRKLAGLNAESAVFDIECGYWRLAQRASATTPWRSGIGRFGRRDGEPEAFTSEVRMAPG